MGKSNFVRGLWRVLLMKRKDFLVLSFLKKGNQIGPAKKTAIRNAFIITSYNCYLSVLTASVLSDRSVG